MHVVGCEVNRSSEPKPPSQSPLARQASPQLLGFEVTTGFEE